MDDIKIGNFPAQFAENVFLMLYLQNILATKSENSFSIGLYSLKNQGPYKYVDGKTPSFLYDVLSLIALVFCINELL